MEPYEVLITKTGYDRDNNETAEIIFGPKIIFAYSKENAIRKATIKSDISVNDVEDVSFYVRNFS